MSCQIEQKAVLGGLVLPLGCVGIWYNAVADEGI
jgi:hypothetical protein